MAYENKTKQTEQSVDSFIKALPDEQTRKDSYELIEIMKSASGHEPKIWGSRMIGFGSYHYKSAAGTEGDWFIVGFAPGKKFSLHLIAGVQANQELLKKLGKFKAGKGCLYINKLADVDKSVLRQLVDESIKANQQFYKYQN